MNGTESPETAPATKKPKSLLITIIAAIGLFILDAIVLHGLSMALIGVLVVAFWLIPAALYALMKGSREIGLMRVKKAIVYSVMALAIFIAFSLNNRLAEMRAESVIGAVTKFNDQRGRYPKSLQELVPGYLETVPRANLTLNAGSFIFFASEDAPSLMYYKYWPFARRCYNFKGRKWSLID
jgi:hypothetical protein